MPGADARSRDPSGKPLDIGTGRVCASFDLETAAWLSIGTPHPEVGFVELANLPPFDERRRGDPDATRAHRLRMTLGEHAFLALEVDGTRPIMAARPGEATWSAPGIEVRATAEPGSRTIRQEWRLTRAGEVRLRLGGRLDRPALAEITELDPPTPTGARTRPEIIGGVVRLTADALGAASEVGVVGPRVTWSGEGDDLVGLVMSGAGTRLTLEVTLAATAAADAAWVVAPPQPPSGLGGLVDQALAYIRGCTALEVAPGERTMLTDHRILPLSWTRDAYWQALALLAADAPGDRERVADHLRWLWGRCERPDGRWVRSHHANGRRKDLAFQADQQLYPLVELADYWRLTHLLPEGVDWDAEVERAWEAALDAVDPRVGLMASTENAADDPAAAPFIGASQILLWYAARRIAELAKRGVLSAEAGAFDRVAADVRRAFRARIADAAGAWAYAVDGPGGRVDYHDANDLPVAVAPIWGFCDANDPGWRATMAFAFSPANPAWFQGDRPGLGSAHTPGPWTLGDVQAWVNATTVGDDEAAAAVLRRLETVAFVDGMLPEAYAATGDTRVRHWFAWPGAALAAMRLLQRDGDLGRLSVSPVR